MNDTKSNNKAKPTITVNIDTVEFTLEGMHFEIPGVTVATVKDSNCQTLDSYGNRVSIKGKYGAHMMHARTMNSGKKLLLEGSPFAYRYGQNVFTSNELMRGCQFVIKRALNKFGIEPSDELREQWGMGDITLKRVDLAVNFRLESESEVLNVIKQIGRQLHERDASMQSFNSSTCFFPRKGKEYSISFYAKGIQMRQAQRYGDLPKADRLINECKNILRVELRLHASKLRKLGLDKASAWKCDTPEKVIHKYWPKIWFLNVTSGPITDSDLEGLPARLRPVMALHKSGVDITRVYSTRTCQRASSFFRKRDIDLRCPNQLATSITSLRKYLSPKKAINDPPGWMKDEGLVPLSAEERDAKRKGKGARSKKLVDKPASTDEVPVRRDPIRKKRF